MKPFEIIPLIDLTSLNITDSHKSIKKLVEKANKGYENLFPASVCTYPKYVKLVKESLDHNIRSCSVSSYFPSSQSPLDLKLQEIKYLTDCAVNEIDIVLPVGEFLDGNDNEVLSELNTIRRSTNSTLKLIIESGVLNQPDQIEKATQFGLESGMDFIKTSTGKASRGAELNAVKIMAKTIKNWEATSGKTVGLKIAGGVKTFDQTNTFIEAVKNILGPNYIHSSTFRIGASSLYDNLITGSYA